MGSVLVKGNRQKSGVQWTEEEMKGGDEEVDH